MNRQLFLQLLLVVCLAGFLYDVVAWTRAGNHSVAEVLKQYWWAVLFVATYAVSAAVSRGRRR